MKVELYRASKYGNRARVAEEIKRLMATHGIEVDIHHVDDSKPKELPSADLFIFGSPTHFGKAPGSMVRFLKKLDLPSGDEICGLRHLQRRQARQEDGEDAV